LLNIRYANRVYLDPKGSSKLAHPGGVAHSNYSILDADGNDITLQVCDTTKAESRGKGHSASRSNELFHPFIPAISVKCYRKLSARRDTEVVIAAGHLHNHRAIIAALRGGMCNTLITDETTAARILVEMSENVKTT
jgi:hypothetical protein